QAVLESWAQRDARIRPLKTEEASGSSAARNLGLKAARGELVAYLDACDEFHEQYLRQVAKLGARHDLVVFGYDFVPHGESIAEQIPPWEPHRMRHSLFARPVAALLGISHRRALLDKVGGFNELLWEREDWDFFKRLVRQGAEPLFMEAKSGRRHLTADGANHHPRLTPRQRETLESNRLAEKPLFGGRPKGAWLRPIRRIVFASPHSLVDYFNGAAIATSQGLECLQRQGFECQAFCGSRLDAPEELLVEEQLARQKEQYEVRKAKIGDYDARMIFAMHGKVPVTLFGSESTRGRWTDEAEIAAFLRAFAIFLDKNRPDAVLTYGGDQVSRAMIDLARNRDLRVVFMLHNCEYAHVEPFQGVDYVTVPSQFCREFYWNKLGLACHHLRNIVDWQRVEATNRRPEYVTFVNPHPTKGVFVFARIAEQLARRRPDIPLLVVESRGRTDWLRHADVDLAVIDNLHRMEITPDPRHFYKVAKLVLIPSLWNETAPLVPIEAMINGIPVLGSTRGGIPEMIGKGGFVFDIPAAYTPKTLAVPTAEEVEPWVETIIRLWDDEKLYAQASQNALEEAENWHLQRLAPMYREFFSNVFHQPAPPLVPKMA
ncbi:MAG: glycosyltransferase, partial [Pirellulales bacterium]